MKKYLYFKSISIINNDTHTGKYVEFKNGINVITSNKDFNGNFVGKSSLLRALYHVLGADGRFSTLWKSDGEKLYVLEFSYDNNDYIMLRYDKLFKLYSNGECIFSVSNRDELSIKLNDIFNKSIYLRSYDGSYKLTPPAFNYLFNYIDQQSLKPFKFDSFDNLTEFSPSRSYSEVLYANLGVDISKLNELNISLAKMNQDKQDYEKQLSMYNEFQKEFSINASSTIGKDLESLKNELENYQMKYSQLANDVEKEKKALYKALNEKIELESLMKDILKSKNVEKANYNRILKKHTCPYCEQSTDQYSLMFFKKCNDIDGLEKQLISVENELNLASRKVDIKQEKYSNKLNELNILLGTIEEATNTQNDLLSRIAKNKLNDEINEKIGLTFKNIEQTKANIKNVQKDIRIIKKKEKEIDSKFYEIFSDIYKSKKMGGFELSKIEKADSKVSVDGARNNITIVAWLSSLIRTKYSKLDDCTMLPIVFDNPNNADLDINNEHTIFEIIFDNYCTKSQIITSLVGFDANDYPDYKIDKIIKLEGEENHLLIESDYEIIMEKYKSIL